ncbi:hypothetical protein HAHE_30290 [Haloferula helveola]|uniref:Type IV pilus assembly protein PilO n=1 Tax=Haloferula helveola TaxID=490095 RepID=A0ABN6H649_9BACT|nr:hypothetical protein HAHE_30290 [Haloferula helveola]
MNLYRQSIALFGFVLPIVLAVAVIGAAFAVKGKVAASFDKKVSHFKGFKQNKVNALAMEAEISKKREDVGRWESMIDKETASSISINLREIEEKLPSKEFQKTAQQYPTARGGFATVSAQNSAQVRLAFRATYRSMQRALLELETRMPQLQLQELRIDPSSNSNSLNFEVNYTAWEK